jgi:hypothetical protein
MPSDRTLRSLDASHAIPTCVLRFEDSGLRRCTPVRPVLLTGQTGPHRSDRSDPPSSSNENPTKIKFVHLEEQWNFGIHLFSNSRHLLFENLDSSYEMLYFLIMIVETHWHDMQWTPWSRLCCHKNVGKKFLIWTSFEKYKQLWSYDYMNQIIKLIRIMNNSITHPNLGADRWGPQLCDSVSSLWKRSFLKPNVPWPTNQSLTEIWLWVTPSVDRVAGPTCW